MYFFVYYSTKHASVYKTYIYIHIYIYIYIYTYKDAADINMLTNVFFFGCLYFIESDTCTTDES